MSARKSLELQLGKDCAALGELDDAECVDLLSRLETARAADREELDRVLAKVIASLPLVVRVPAKKIMFG